MSISSTLFDSLIGSCLGVLSSWFVSHVSNLEDLRPTNSFVSVSSSNCNVFGSLVCIDHPILDHGSNLQYCYELACAQMGWWLRVEGFVRHTFGNFGWWYGK